MKLNIEIELTDKEIEYIKFIDDIRDEFGTFEIDYYQLNKGKFSNEHQFLESKSIVEYHFENEYYYTTFLFDEILKQLSK